eukprot:SAG31_NODE_1576_length_7838_cov_5.738468_3_plen_78_part_00
MGLNLLPKHDVLRRLAEKLELKHSGWKLTRAFRKYDEDGSGKLDRNELRAAIASIGFELNDRVSRPNCYKAAQQSPC